VERVHNGHARIAIVLTERARGYTAELARRAGFNGYVWKPVAVEKLCFGIAAMLVLGH